MREYTQLLSNNRMYLLLFMVVNFILFYAIYRHKVVIDVNLVGPNGNLYSTRSLPDSLNFFNREASVCEDLLNDWDKFAYSDLYQDLKDAFDKDYKATKQPNDEGHSAQVKPQMVLLHYIAKQNGVRTICETGFNYGHSSFNFLTANSKAHVYSFDLGSHTYVAKMNSTIGRLFPSRRHHLVIGDSTKTVPKLVEEKKLPLCDVAFVDGGHVYPVARADMANFATHMSKDNLIIFDDYPTNWGVSFGKAWEEVLTGGTLKKREKIKFNEIRSELKAKMVTEGDDEVAKKNSQFRIKELLRCKMRKSGSLERGFTVGTVIAV